MMTDHKTGKGNYVMNRQYSHGVRLRKSGIGQQNGWLRWIEAAVLCVAAGAWPTLADGQIKKGEMAGYLIVPIEKVPEYFHLVKSDSY
jgi:hypothetical protein